MAGKVAVKRRHDAFLYDDLPLRKPRYRPSSKYSFMLQTFSTSYKAIETAIGRHSQNPLGPPCRFCCIFPNTVTVVPVVENCSSSDFWGRDQTLTYIDPLHDEAPFLSRGIAIHKLARNVTIRTQSRQCVIAKEGRVRFRDG